MKRSSLLSVIGVVLFFATPALTVAQNNPNDKIADAGKGGKAPDKDTRGGAVTEAQANDLHITQRETCSDCVQPNELTYDFKCKHFYYQGKWVNDPRDVKVFNNQEFKVRVVNINRYMYNVGVTADNILFQSEQPKLFKELALGEGTLLPDLLTRLKEDKAIQLSAAAKGDFKSKLVEFLRKYYELMGNQLKANNYCTENLPCCADKQKLDFASFANLFLELKLKYVGFNDSLQKDLTLAKAGVDSADKALTNCRKDPTKPNCDPIEKILNSHKGDQARLDTVISHMNKLWGTISKIGETDLMRHILFSNNLVGDHMFFYSPPIFPKGNKLSIKLSFSSADSSLIRKWNIMPLYNDSAEIELTVRGKWFASFSTGPFVAFGPALKDESYGTARKETNNVVTDTSSYKIVPLQGNPLLPGISAFANFGLKRNGLGVGFSPGVGMTIEKHPRPVYLFGASLYVGDKNQFNVTFGGALTPVASLNAELYNTNALYKSAPDLQYRRALKAGLFVSINYTFYSYATVRGGSGRSKSK